MTRSPRRHPRARWCRRSPTACWTTGVYTFVVRPDANKIEIRQAVEEIFDVTVVKVNTLNRKGKRKRQPQAADVRQAARHQAGDRDPRRRRPHPDLFES